MSSGMKGDRGQAAVESVDLTTCEREPIHLLGRVQSLGFLVGVSPDWMVTHASVNIQDHLDVAAADCVGEPLATLISAHCIHNIRNRLQFLRGHEGVESSRNQALRENGGLYDILIHLSGETIVLEFEPSRPKADPESDITMVRAFMARLAEVSSVEKFCSDTARYMQALTGLDRVMIYKFLQDDSGEVVAEVKAHGMEPFLHLRYPASDIPKQARALYLKSPIRIIADAKDPGHPIYPDRDPTGEPIDLSRSMLRTVSPIHLEYLANMDVAASLSVSIIVQGRLWGLVACHHREPMVLDQAKRSAIDLFGQTMSLILAGKLFAEETARDDQLRKVTNAFTCAVSVNQHPTDEIMPMLKEFAHILGADGVGMVLDGATALDGGTPTTEEFARIVKFLNRASGQSVFATNEIGAVMEDGADFVGRAAGLLAIPISRTPRDYIVFFRKEIVRSVVWAGNPDKPVTLGPSGIRLTPRKSFESWRAIVEGQSEPWTPANIRAADHLRLTLLEVVLRFADEAARERKTAQNKQQFLIAELNHRVRNILGLVRGIISQSTAESLSTADYVEVLDLRIQALARAHDQITEENWSAASVTALVRTEAESFLLGGDDRVVISGDNYFLEPAAYPTLALVVHEMMTNSAKYGALSERRGRLDIAVALTPSGALSIEWTESGGPPVKAPTRRGFGSTIIERCIPFELNGTTTVDYALSGVHAFFEIPARYVAKVVPAADAADAADKSSEPDDVLVPPESVLIVEDNMLIALEGEDLLRDLGATHVAIAGNLDMAEAVLKDMPIDFALLDVNLGSQTSFVLAKRLIGEGIAVGFASGYGDSESYPADMKTVPRIAKPYDKKRMAALLRAAGFVRTA